MLPFAEESQYTEDSRVLEYFMIYIQLLNSEDIIIRCRTSRTTIKCSKCLRMLPLKISSWHIKNYQLSGTLTSTEIIAVMLKQSSTKFVKHMRLSQIGTEDLTMMNFLADSSPLMMLTELSNDFLSNSALKTRVRKSFSKRTIPRDKGISTMCSKCLETPLLMKSNKHIEDWP